MVSIAQPHQQASSPDDAPAPDRRSAVGIPPRRRRSTRTGSAVAAGGPSSRPRGARRAHRPATRTADSLLLAEVSDASLPLGLTSDSTVAYLSAGAPTGSIVLASLPTQTGGQQPVAPTVITGLAANGIPNVALNAYRVAAARMASASPSCGIDWSLLAGIGRVESNHGRYRGAVLNPDGTSTPRILGPPLDGVQFAFIGDSDRGVWDGDTTYDRAMGPMQFIPTTWRAYAIDADGDGVTDPFNINDAALAAANYLCVAGGNLRTDAGQRKAVLAYNHSDSYVNEVLALARAYASGIPVADIPIVGNTTGAVPAPRPTAAPATTAPRRTRPGHRPHGHDAALRPHHGAVRLLQRGTRRFRRPAAAVRAAARRPRRRQRWLRLAAPGQPPAAEAGFRLAFGWRFRLATGGRRWRRRTGRSRPPGACPRAGPSPGPAPAPGSAPAAASPAAGTGPRRDVHDLDPLGSDLLPAPAPLPVTNRQHDGGPSDHSIGGAAVCAGVSGQRGPPPRWVPVNRNFSVARGALEGVARRAGGQRRGQQEVVGGARRHRRGDVSG